MREDLTGKRFGNLTVIRKTDQKNRSSYLWLCKCDCGKEKLVSSYSLKSGMTKSCGCLGRKERTKDITGEKFWHLTAIRPTGKYIKNQAEWVWRCECGKEIKEVAHAVKIGNRRSCGCRNKNIKVKQAIEMQKKNQRVDGTSISSLKSTKVATNNTTGYRGVSFRERKQIFVARITFKGRTYHLGSYKTAKEASVAYLRAKEELHFKYIEEFEKKQREGITC